MNQLAIALCEHTNAGTASEIRTHAMLSCAAAPLWDQVGPKPRHDQMGPPDITGMATLLQRPDTVCMHCLIILRIGQDKSAFQSDDSSMLP